MSVINHKLNMIRRHGDDLCDLYKSYMKNQKIGTDSVKLLMSKFARYLAKVWYKQKHANCQSTSLQSITSLKICILNKIFHQIVSTIIYVDNTSKVVIPSG